MTSFLEMLNHLARAQVAISDSEACSASKELRGESEALLDRALTHVNAAYKLLVKDLAESLAVGSGHDTSKHTRARALAYRGYSDIAQAEVAAMVGFTGSANFALLGAEHALREALQIIETLKAQTD